MPVPKGYKFDLTRPHEAYPRGLVLTGEIEPDNEYQSQEDRARNRAVSQRVDEATGKRMWKGTLTDPSETKPGRASFPVHFVSDVQPVPSTEEVLPGMRPVELEGLQVQPKVGGQGEFKYLTYEVWATGIKDTRTNRKGSTGTSSGSGASSANGSQSGAAA